VHLAFRAFFDRLAATSVKNCCFFHRCRIQLTLPTSKKLTKELTLKKSVLGGAMRKGLHTFLAAILALGTSGMAFASSTDQPSTAGTSNADIRIQQRLSGEVRHELNMIPQFTVFDNLAYRVDGSTVTLFGQVRDAIVKDSAEKRVKRLEGVERVNNQIEILPASFNDDRIRRQVARAVFNDSRLFSYAIQPVPPIHIIVKNGHVNLEGIVRTQVEKDDAFIRANGVPGVFSVQNNLQVEQPRKG
jgi:hyperosmotically inducible periplasmic protein